MDYVKKEKAKIVFLNTEETYRSLQPFKDVKELNANTAAIRERFGEKLLNSTKEILDLIVRYSCKFPGVCYMTKSKIAELTGYSTKTVRRACTALGELGLILQYETKRRNGDRRQSSNAIVFVPLEKREVEPVKPVVLPGCPTKETPSKAPLKPLRDTDVTYTGISEQKGNSVIKFHSANVMDKWIVESSRLPDGWLQAAAPYVFDSEDFYKLTGTLYKAKKHTTIRIEDYIETFAGVLRGAWYKFKKGLVKLENRMAYLFGAFRNTAEEIERAEAAALLRAESALFYDPNYVSVPSRADCPYTVYSPPEAEMDGYISVMF